MAWPTGKPDTTAFDSADDAISNARAELQTMSTSVGQMVDFIDTTGITSGQALVYDSVNDKLVAGDVGGETYWSADSGGILETDYDVLQLGKVDSAADGRIMLENSTNAFTCAWRLRNANQIANSGTAGYFEYVYKGIGGGASGEGRFTMVSGGTPGSTGASVVFRASATQINLNSTNIGLNGTTTVTGDLKGTDGFNGFNISSEGLTGGHTTIWNDASQESYIKVGEGDIIIAPSQDSANKGTVDLQIPTSTTASAGAQTLPSNPVGFLGIKINGIDYKVPYYNT